MKPAFAILIASIAVLAFAPSASALDDVECPVLPNAVIADPCGGGGEEPEFGNLSVNVSTSPAATVGSPGWDDENLTYTATVTNLDAVNEATGVEVVAETTQGTATFVSSSASQGTCSGTTCSIGTIAPEASKTMTLVVRPAAGTVRTRFTATATEVGSDFEIQTSTIRSSAASAAIDWSMPERARGRGRQPAAGADHAPHPLPRAWTTSSSQRPVAELLPRAAARKPPLSEQIRPLKLQLRSATGRSGLTALCEKT